MCRTPRLLEATVARARCRVSRLSRGEDCDMPGLGRCGLTLSSKQVSVVSVRWMIHCTLSSLDTTYIQGVMSHLCRFTLKLSIQSCDSVKQLCDPNHRSHNGNIFSTHSIMYCIICIMNVSNVW